MLSGKQVALVLFSLLGLGSAIKHDFAPGSEKDTAIGIDLGTTYSAVSYYAQTRPEIIADKQGARTMPSYVAFNGKDRMIGHAAKNRLEFNPENTVYDVKRLIGRKFSDPSVQKDIKNYPFKVIGKNDVLYIQVMVDGKIAEFVPEELSAMILRQMKEIAEEQLGVPITNAVITVPAYFNDKQRQATKDAGQIAGLNVMRIINEPTAAAIAFGVNKSSKSRTVIVFDCGGGTHDVTLLNIEEGVIEVEATNGDPHLGGEDFDMTVLQFFLKEMKKKHNLDLKSTDARYQALRREIEKAKRSFVKNTEATIHIPDFFGDDQDFEEKLLRSQFEKLNEELFQRTLTPVKQVLKDKNLKPSQIDEVVLVGGSTRILQIQKLLKDLFNGKELCTQLDPDEAVALGAAVQAAIIMGKETTSDIVVLDATPLSMGIETQGGVMTTLIPRNSRIPTNKTQVFSTAMDNQPSVNIKVYEGERTMVQQNHLLGQFELTNIPPAPKGVPQIEVSFDIDVNSILTVGAKDLGTSQKANIVITDKNRLRKEDIERMVQEAEQHKEEDSKIRENIQKKQEFANYVYPLKKQLENPDFKSKLSADDVTALEDAVQQALKFLESGDSTILEAEAYMEKKKELEDIAMPIVSKVYQQGGAQDAQQAAEEDDSEL